MQKKRNQFKWQKIFLTVLLLFTLISLSATVSTADPNYIYTNDFRELIYQIGTSWTTRHTLANIAHCLGYCWCGGTNYNVVGEGFDVWLEGDVVHMRAHYNSSDPYASGVDGSKMLEIVLHDFRYDIRPENIYIQSDQKTVSQIDQINASMVELINNDQYNSASLESWLQYTSSATLKNEVNGNITESMRIQESVNAGFSIGSLSIGSSSDFEYNTSVTNGWVNSYEVATSTTHTARAVATVAANSKKIAKVVQIINEASIPYSCGTGIIFNATFKGYLRDSGNAKWGSPGGRPYLQYTFGNNNDDCYAAIYYEDRYGSSTWDWDWARANSPNCGDWINYIHANGVGVHNLARVFVSGRFKIRGDSNTWIDISANLPIVPNVWTLNGRYSFHPVNSSSKACDAAGGAAILSNILQYDWHWGSNQLWQVRQVSGEWHKIISEGNSSLGWDVGNVSLRNGANIQLFTYWGGNNQLFKFQKAGSGRVRIIARHSDKCADVDRGYTTNGTNILQWQCNAGATNQMFYIYER